MYAFALLDQLVSYNKLASLSSFVKEIFRLLFSRMMENKTPQYIRLFLHSLFLFSATYGGQLVFETCESIQPEMTTLIITKVLDPNLEGLSSVGKNKLGRIVVGATKLLCESSVSQNAAAWTVLCRAVIALFLSIGETPDKASCADAFLEDDENAEAREFDSTYSKLAYAHVPDVTFSPEAAQPQLYFISTLVNLCRSSPGRYAEILGQCLDAPSAAYVQSLLQQAGLSIV